MMNQFVQKDYFSEIHFLTTNYLPIAFMEAIKNQFKEEGEK